MNKSLLYSSIKFFFIRIIQEWKFYLCILIGFLIRIYSFQLYPIWEDDWARYIWEGNLLKENYSPYLNPPIFFFGSENFSEPNSIEILSRINHPDLTTIYSPLIERFFQLSQFISNMNLTGFRILYLVIDFFILFFLMRIDNKLSAIIYWLHPILLKEIYLNIHFELIPVFFLIFAFYLREKKKNTFYYLLSWFLYGLSIHCKILSIIALPYFVFRKKPSLVFIAFGMVMLMLGFSLPFIFFPIDGALNSFSTIILFGMNFEFNSFLYGILKYLTNEKLAKLISAFSICISFFICYLYRNFIWKNSIRSSYAISYLYIWYFLWSPIINPWYFIYILPFIAITKNRNLLLLLIVPQISYFTNIRLNIPDDGFYNLNLYVRLIEFFLYFGLGFQILFSKTKKIIRTTN